MSEDSHDIKDVLVGITEENIEQKMEDHNKRVIKAIKFLGLTVVKIHTRITKPSGREIQIQSMISGN